MGKNEFIKMRILERKILERILFALLLTFILLSPFPAFAQSSMESTSAENDSTLYIGKIEIIRKNVFDPEIKDENKKLFLLVNKFHFLTKERVIRQELLFKEGEVYDEKLMEESERNLRNLNFLGKVTLEAKRDRERMDVLVRTQDQWSTTVNFSAQAVGKFYSVEAYMEEHNFLGWGKSLIAGYLKNSERNQRQLTYWDGNMWGTHLLLQTDLYDRSDGHLYNFLFSRPFYSLETISAFTVQYLDEKSDMDYFQEGEELFSFQKKNKQLYLELGRSSGSEKKGVIYWFYQSQDLSNSFYQYSDSQNYGELLPQNRKLRQSGLSFKLWHPEFEKLSYLDNFGRIEDVDLGWRFQGTWGWDVCHPFDKRRTDMGSFRFLLPFRLGKKQFLFLAHLTKGELENYRWERVLSQTEARIYWTTPYWQTLVMRALSVSSTRQEKGYQLLLGGTNGLRGFEISRFSGKNEVILNLEDRIFSPWRILTVALGGILFFDAGYMGEDNLFGQKLHADAGAGLLLGFTKSYNWRIVRLDLAKSLDTNDWIVSFGSDLYFEIGDF